MRDNEQALYDQIEQDLLVLPAANSEIEAAAMALHLRHRIVRFRGKTMILVQEPYPHFVSLDKEAFERNAYPLLGGITKVGMNDVFAHLCSSAADVTAYEHFILFGAGTRHQIVWDMDRLETRTDISPDDCIWRSPYAPIPVTKPIKFIMDLVGGDEGLYSDILQSLAPLVMAQKPVGVIWWIGGNLEAKLALFDALYKIFPQQLTNLTVKQLNGGRGNTPLLNGALGNMALDGGGQITNTEVYKSIGTHEDLNMHRYHSQNGITIRGNVHHIFAASHAPTFYARNLSIERRTHTVPFIPIGNPIPTLPNSLYGQLIAEMCRHAAIIKQRGYSYAWSAANAETNAPEPALSHPTSKLPEFRW